MFGIPHLETLLFKFLFNVTVFTEKLRQLSETVNLNA